MRYGYFDDESREYVIDHVDVRVSRTNYLGVSNMCAVLSQNAAATPSTSTPSTAA